MVVRPPRERPVRIGSLLFTLAACYVGGMPVHADRRRIYHLDIAVVSIRNSFAYAIPLLHRPLESRMGIRGMREFI